MTRPRIAVLALALLFLLMALGRVLLELGVAMVGGEVHAALLDAPLTYLLTELFALWVLAVTFAVSAVGTAPIRRRMVVIKGDSFANDSPRMRQLRSLK